MKILCLLQTEDASDSVGVAFIRCSSKYHIASENYEKSLKKKDFNVFGVIALTVLLLCVTSVLRVYFYGT